MVPLALRQRRSYFARPTFVEALEPRHALAAVWAGYAHDAQHTAVSSVASQPLEEIVWQTPVDKAPQFSGDALLVHYGSPIVTAANTVIVPVKTGATDGFELEAFDGATGAPKWTQATDYVLPPHNWVPSYSPTLSVGGRLYFAGAGGTVDYLDAPDANGAATSGQFAFYGLSTYTMNAAAYNATVFINTPITADGAGNIYFGFQVTGANSANLQSGIARIDPLGNGTWISATAAAGDAKIVKVATNSAPAVSNDGKTVYVAVSEGDFGGGYLVALDSATLSPIGQGPARVRLKDPDGSDALVPDIGSASPTVGPNGDVFFGVLENPFPYNHDRGWLLHFSAELSQTFAPGAFGWDDTASVVPAAMVPGYAGGSPYLLMTKYNNYAGLGGDGVNRLAIVDPLATMSDPVTGAIVMKEVLTIAGVTPDFEFPGQPGAVREWCINTAAVDPQTDSVLANSEDGKLYRWNLGSNTFTEVITLTPGIGEAYTPTVIGVDGKVYAINNATLFAVGRAVQRPVAADLSIPTAEDNFVEVTLSATNPGDNPLTYSIASGPAHGTLSGESPNLTYLPDPDYNGSDSFSYVASAGGIASNTATVSITIAPVNDAPRFVAGPDPSATDDGGPQVIPGWAADVVAGGPDETTQRLSFAVQTQDLDLFLVSPEVGSDGTLSFTPAPNVRGTATVTIQLHDDGGTAAGGSDASSVQTFAITITKAHVWHNTMKPLDVTGDGGITNADALATIDFLNTFGAQLAPGDGRATGPYYDTTADGLVAPLDAMRVINYLNTFGPDAAGESDQAYRPDSLSASSVLPAATIGPSPLDALLSLLAADAASQARRRQ